MKITNLFQAKSDAYGVFIGLSPSEISKLTQYKEVVIDAYYYTKEDIDYLHQHGVKVYSYLNIGSIEEFRPYYENFKHITLGRYDNWEDELWIDVSKTEWQVYILDVIAKDLYDKGVDGLFIDNSDVYCLYKEEKIFDGIYKILDTLSYTYDKPLIVNGGYEFITTARSKNISINNFLYGINLEEVYTNIDNYDNNTFSRKPQRDIDFTLNYLESIEEEGLTIYIIEYTKDSKLIRELMKHYKKLDFKLFISEKVNLS